MPCTFDMATLMSCSNLTVCRHKMPKKEVATQTSGFAADPVTGLVFGCILDGKGGCRHIGWEDAQDWTPQNPGDVLWLHMDRTVEAVASWSQPQLKFFDATLEVLLSNETRPRAFREEDTMVTILRGINFNPNAEREDMIALQIWADDTRVVSFRRRPLQTPRDILARLDAGQGPNTSGDLLTDLIEQLVAKMNVAIVDMNDEIDVMEDNGDNLSVEMLLDKISDIRRNCLALKRYMSPQHEALLEIRRNPPSWLTKANLTDIRETLDRLARYLEDLDVSKESALVLQDDLDSRASHKTNHTMYILSIITAVFLPLGFITGLLGINVGGMPGVNSHYAFWITVTVLVGLMSIQFWLFRKLKWL